MVQYGGDGPFLFGKDVSYVDLAIMHLINGIEHAYLNNFENHLMARIPKLVRLRDAAMKLDRIAAYHKSDRSIEFSKDGIFRHYPELDI